MAWVGRSVMLSLDKDNEALEKGKANFVIIARDQNAFFLKALCFKNDSLFQISTVGRALKRIYRMMFHFFLPFPKQECLLDLTIKLGLWHLI
jgi:hypothetical protein